MKRLWILLPLIAVIVGTAAWLSGGKNLGNQTTGTRIKAAKGYNVTLVPEAKRPRKALIYDGTDLDGEPVYTSRYLGHVTVINFWASWCGPCRQEQPVLEKVWNAYKEKDVLFLGVDVRDRDADARSHISEFGVTYPSISNFDSSIANKFRVVEIPQTFILDTAGRIAVKIFGATPGAADLSKLIDGVLGLSR